MADRETPDSSAQGPITAIPDELFLGILNNFAAEPPSLTTLSPVDAQVYNNRGDERFWQWNGLRRNDLRTCALVSKRFCCVTRTVLYHTIAINQPRTLARLMRTFIENQGLGKLVRSISCQLILTSRLVTTACVEEFLQKVSGGCRVHYGFQSYARQAGSSMRELAGFDRNRDENVHKLPQRMLLSILAFTSQLQTLFLTIPSPGRGNRAWAKAPFNRWSRSHSRNYDLVNYKTLVEQLASRQVLRVPMCARLRSLVLQADPTRRYRVINDLRNTSIDEWAVQEKAYITLLSSFGAIQNFATNFDEGGFWHLPGPVNYFFNRRFEPVASVRKVVLTSSFSSPRDIAELLRGFPLLQSLAVSNTDFPIRKRQHPHEVPSRGLETSLLLYGRHLQHLDVTWIALEDFARGIGTRGPIIGSLATLRDLSTLRLQLGLLFTDGHLRSHLPIPPRLPEGIQELTLVEWFPKDLRFYDNLTATYFHPGNVEFRRWHVYRLRVIKKLLLCLAAACGRYFYRLRRVLYEIPIHARWIPTADDDTTLCVHFAAAHTAFSLRRVEFVVKKVEVKGVKI